MTVRGWFVLMGLAVLLISCGGGAVGGPSQPAILPVLTGITPVSAFASGGAMLTVSGTGFQEAGAGVPVLRIGGTLATAVAILDDETLTCVLPAGTAGTADVQVSNDLGSYTISGAFLYVAYPPGFAGPETSLATEPPGAASVGSPPRLACDGDAVYVIWSDMRNATGDIFFTRSLDRGRTWLETDRKLNTPGPDGYENPRPLLKHAGNNVYVAWLDGRHGGSIYFNRSTDRGETWLARDVRLDLIAREPEGLALASTGDSVYVAWTDGSSIHYNRSLDGGLTWLSQPTELFTLSTGAQVLGPELCCWGSNVIIVWSDDRNVRFDVFYNRSVDAGDTWLPTEVRLNGGPPGASDSAGARLCCDGGRVYVAWTDTRNGGYGDIYFNRSSDGGATWLASGQRLNTDVPGISDSESAQMSCAGDHVYVAWLDSRNGNYDIYFNHSYDAGKSWQSGDTRLDTDDAGVGMSYWPMIACDGPNVFVAWLDWRSGGWDDVYFNVSGDHGATWLASDMRVDTDPPGAAGISRDPGDSSFNRAHSVCCTGTRAFFGWSDNRWYAPPAEEPVEGEDPPVVPPGTDVLVRATQP